MWEGLCSSSTHPTCYTPLGGSCLYASYHWASVRCTVWNLKLIVLKYFALPFTLFEPWGAVFNMNSKVHLRRNSGKDFQPLCLGYSSLLFLWSSVSCCRRYLRWAKRCFLCSAISSWRLLLRCSRWMLHDITLHDVVGGHQPYIQ